MWWNSNVDSVLRKKWKKKSYTLLSRDVYFDRRRVASELIGAGRWIISILCRAACNNAFMCHKTDRSALRVPLTHSADLPPSTCALPVPRTTRPRIEATLFWRPDFTTRDRKWNAGEYRTREGGSVLRVRGMKAKRKRREDEGGWIGVAGGPRDSRERFCFAIELDERATSTVGLSTVIPRHGGLYGERRNTVESAEFLTASHRPAWIRCTTPPVQPTVVDPAAFYGRRVRIYATGRATVAWRIVRFTIAVRGGEDFWLWLDRISPVNEETRAHAELVGRVETDLTRKSNCGFS